MPDPVPTGDSNAALRLDAAVRSLAQAPPYRLAEDLAAALAAEYGFAAADLLLVDYRLSALLNLRDGGSDVDHGSPAWRCFDRQDPVADELACHLPVTVRGNRLGVLRLAPARLAADPAVSAELVEIARRLAHEIAAANGTTDRYVVASRTHRMTLAAEMQWELLPGRSRDGEAFQLAGQLEPAYAVRGDLFDWSDDPGRVWLSTINGMGDGVEAAALSSLTITALRNARRAGLSLADQAALADQALYSYYRGARYVGALLMELDLASGRLTVTDAGSPDLLLLRDGEVSAVPVDEQDPLGMFDGSKYLEQHHQLRPGDRIFVVSDGVSDAVAREIRYGDTRLRTLLRRTGTLPPLEAVRTLLSELRAFVGADLDDDAVAVCIDWRPISAR